MAFVWVPMADERPNRRSQFLCNWLSCELTARMFFLFDLSDPQFKIYASYIHPSQVANSQYDHLPVGFIAQL